MTKCGWTTLKSLTYNEAELNHEWDEDYFRSTKGTKGDREGARTTRDLERFLGFQLIVRK
jgi:hypothetical protein